jgi:hypothetical protein
VVRAARARGYFKTKKPDDPWGFYYYVFFFLNNRARAPRVPRARGSTAPEFVVSGVKIAARANYKSLVAARLQRIEDSRAEFSVTSLRVPCTRVYEKCAEIPARAPSILILYCHLWLPSYKGFGAFEMNNRLLDRMDKNPLSQIWRNIKKKGHIKNSLPSLKCRGKNLHDNNHHDDIS